MVAALCTGTHCNWMDQWKGEFEMSQSNLGDDKILCGAEEGDGSR